MVLSLGAAVASRAGSAIGSDKYDSFCHRLACVKYLLILGVVRWARVRCSIDCGEASMSYLPTCPKGPFLDGACFRPF